MTEIIFVIKYKKLYEFIIFKNTLYQNINSQFVIKFYSQKLHNKILFSVKKRAVKTALFEF